MFLSGVVDAMERLHAVTCDMPGAFIQADMDELVHMKLEGEFVELVVKLDESYASVVSDL